MSEQRNEVVLRQDDRGRYINHVTGESVSADSPDHELVAFLAFLREARSALGLAKRDIDAELLRRMDARREWTIPGAHAPSPTAGGDWRVDDVKRELDRQVDAGVLDAAVASACFRIKVEVVAANLNRVIAGASPEDAARLLALRDRAKTRSVSIDS